MWYLTIAGTRYGVTTDDAQTLRSLGLVTTGSYAARILSLTEQADPQDVIDLLDVDDSPLTDSERASSLIGTRPAAASTYQAA